MKAFLQFVVEEAKNKPPVRQSKKVNEMSGEDRDAEYARASQRYQASRKAHNFDKVKLHNLPEPGETPIPHDHIRLYHQTSEENANHIKKHGIKMEHAKGIEGPKAIWADPHGFYRCEAPSIRASIRSPFR